MKNNKTPGQDGIPANFYKVLWGMIQKPFYEMALECYQQNVLHNSARMGILNLIPKGNKDSRYVKNLKPITLLNTDYKVIEKSIAAKMMSALKEIINKDQRGFMKDRRISVNIRKVLDIMSEAEKEDLEAVILSLDFVKCFDKCSFAILHGSLEYFGFGSFVKEWTKIIYKDVTVKVQNNGYFSQSLDIKKGVHQGGCCSSLYFLVIAEILAISMRANKEIEGIMLYDIKNILNQFADDMDVFSMNKEKSLRSIIQELQEFRNQSGFTVSYEKTTLYRIGSLRHSNAMMYDMTQFMWSNTDITVLGITITHEDIVMKNYEPLIEKVKNTLDTWHNRNLSLIGKVQVVNTLVASQFVYKMMVLPTIPRIVVKRVDNIVRDFLWNSKKAKITYASLQNSKKDGGLGLVNLQAKDKSLKATWPGILVQEKEYSVIVYGVLRCSELQEDIWRCNLLPEDVRELKMRNKFWEDVLVSWSEYNFNQKYRIENQIIWYNSRIRIRNKPVMWRDVYRRGLKYVYQLFNNLAFKSNVQVKEEFGLSIIRYNSFKLAICRDWKEYFYTHYPQEFLPVPPHMYDISIQQGQKGLSARVYKYIASDISLIHSKYTKWSQELGFEICSDIFEFGRLHLQLYQNTNVQKYRDFQ